MTNYTFASTHYPENADRPIKRVKFPVPPKQTNIKNYILGDEWLDTSAAPFGEWWKLTTKSTGGMQWTHIGGQGGDLETLTGDSGGPVSPDINDNINILGTAGQITVTGTPINNTLTLSLAGGGGPETFTVDASTPPGTNPVAPDGSNIVTITGAQVAAGTTTNVIQTDSLAANTITIEVQRSSAQAVSTIGANGVSHFNSANFTVDANGFVDLSGSITGAITEIDVDASTPPGTDPVVPTVPGVIAMTGAQVAAGTTANVIRTDSLAANSLTIEIQRSSAQAATTIGANGVSHFDSAQFAVDANGFVQLAGGGLAVDSFNVDASTAPGTDPVVPDATGQVTITGAQVAAGTTANVIRTDSLAANTYTIEVQRASAEAVTTIGSNGVAHFNSAQFTVDANGFVSVSGGGGTGTVVTLTGNTGGAVNPDGGGNINVVGSGTLTVTGSPGTNTLTISEDNSTQPAFFAYLGSSDNNVMGNAPITYVLGSVTPLTIVFDLGSDFVNTGTFTAPTTGKYSFSSSTTFADILNANVALGIITSNRAYASNSFGPGAKTNSTVIEPNLFILADMDIGDTAFAQAFADNEATNRIDIGGSPVVRTYFCGYLVF